MVEERLTAVVEDTRVCIALEQCTTPCRRGKEIIPDNELVCDWHYDVNDTTDVMSVLHKKCPQTKNNTLKKGRKRVRRKLRQAGEQNKVRSQRELFFFEHAS